MRGDDDLDGYRLMRGLIFSIPLSLTFCATVTWVIWVTWVIFRR
jgi:hypothetical protein